MANQENNNQSKTSEDSEVLSADVKPLAKISRVWFIPIVAILIGIWMIYFFLE